MAENYRRTADGEIIVTIHGDFYHITGHVMQRAKQRGMSSKQLIQALEAPEIVTRGSKQSYTYKLNRRYYRLGKFDVVVENVRPGYRRVVTVLFRNGRDWNKYKAGNNG